MATIASTDPVISQGTVAGLDPSSAEMAYQAANTLTAYSVYPGVVVEVNYSTMELTVSVNRTIVSGVQYATNTLAAYFGVGTATMPAVGATVLLVYIPGYSWCIGMQNKTQDQVTAYAGVLCGDVSKEEKAQECESLQWPSRTKTAEIAYGMPLPEDMYPGETEVGAGAGAVLRLLMNFSQLSSGGVALVETHLLNDMVRIVSNYFAHHSCGGDDLIWTAKHCNHETHFTPYPFEAEGKLNKTDPLAETVGDNVVDPLKSCKGSPESDTGRWRVSRYIGFLGDIIHMWVTDPTKVISSYMEGATRAGKCRAWVGPDGTVVVQSVNGVHIEVNPTVVIPTVHYAWNDPKFDWEKAMQDLDTEYVKMWGTGPNYDDMKVAVWQMRSYAKYLTLWHSLTRWHQLAKHDYCNVPTEYDAEVASIVNAEIDREAMNPTNTMPVGGYAAISILPDGSISINSGGTTSVIMNQGSIQINAPGNIEFNAGGIISFSGKAFSAKAVNDVELVSLTGGLFLKARTAWHALCEKGRVWLKSDAREGETDPGRSATNGPIENVPEMEQCGIILDATRSKVLASGKTGAILTSTGAGARTQVQALGEGGTVSIYGTVVNILSKTIFKVKAIGAAIAANVMKLASMDIKLGDSTRVTPIGVVTDKFVLAQTMGVTAGYLGPNKDNYKPIAPIELKIESGGDVVGDEAQAMRRTDYVYEVDKEEFVGYKWRYPNWGVPFSPANPDSLKVGSTLDKCFVDPDWQEYNFYEVKWNRCTLEPCPRTDSTTTPWPGKGAKMLYYDNRDAKPLGKKWERHYSSSDIGQVKDMKLRPYTFLVNKPTAETVYTPYDPDTDTQNKNNTGTNSSDR